MAETRRFYQPIDFNEGVTKGGVAIPTISSTSTLTNKTITAPVLGGTVTGTYTLGGTPTLTAGTIATSLAMGAATTWSGTPTVTGVPSFIGATAGAVTAALVFGGGTSATPCTTSTADKNFLAFWTQSTATSGDSRGLYIRHYLGAAGSGEALRAFGTATAANVATGGTANGAHISFELSGASASISGRANAARLTLGGDAQTRTINGNMGCLNVDSNFATGNTIPATVAFIKVTDTGAVRINTLFCLPNAANGTLLATHTAQTDTHSIKIATDDGTVYYIPCHATATGRG